MEEGRYLASRIPGAAFLELPGDDHLSFVGDQTGVLDAIEAFLAGREAIHPSERVLATVLAITCDGDRAGEARRVFERDVSRARGRMLSEAAGLAAAFDGPGRAVQSGVVDLVHGSGLQFAERDGPDGTGLSLLSLIREA